MIYPDKYCPACGRLFVPKCVTQVYCSPECNKKAKSRREWEKRKVKQRVCKVCGKTFTPSAKFKTMCSVGCQNQVNLHPPIKGICKFCGKEFMGPKGKSFCCKEHSRAWAEGKIYVEAEGKRESTLDSVNAEALSKGMSYGQYKAMLYIQEHKFGG